MEETPREKWASYILLAFTIIPGMIVAGFMPEWNVLPFVGWLGIAMVGSALAGVVATPRSVRGAIAGAVTGAGVLLGIFNYVAVRSALTGHNTFLKIELVVGAILGGLPGYLLYSKWASKPSPNET